MLSESTEMYLITIYRLIDRGDEAHISDIAEGLTLHHSSVSEKVKRLAEQGYVNYAEDGIRLTDQGKKVAVNVLRKHRIVKTFLVQVVGYPIDEVYDEACRLEHVISERLTDGLEKLLDYPDTDPHGYPIPRKDGTISAQQYQTLNDFTTGDYVTVKRVDALQHEKLTYLRQLGLIPGTIVKITNVEPFDGPLVLDVNGKTIAIAPSLAQEIEVDRMDEQHAT